MGVNDKKDGSDEYKIEELRRMLEYEDIAKQNQDKLPFGEGEIKKMIFLKISLFFCLVIAL